MTLPLATPRAFDEDAPHRLRRRAKEMRAAIELRICVAHEPQPRLMHQCGRLQGLPAASWAIFAAASLRSSS